MAQMESPIPPIQGKFAEFSAYADSIWAWRENTVSDLTTEGVDSSCKPLHYGISHFSSPHTLDAQVLETRKKTINNLSNCVV